ncbi:MAG: hypothetical protein E6G19_01440 [Actinobacteria bacterium]|nr:MAG: hypothetical protein E6G19_01440 [Actinomycetota bacterium]
MLTHFQREVRAVAEQYPEARSAVMPALRLAQEQHEGWLPPEALVEVADALDLTPAFVKGVATFYDMFHLVRARDRTGRDDARRSIHAASRRVHRRLRLADGRCDRRPSSAERFRRGHPSDRPGAAR